MGCKFGGRRWTCHRRRPLRPSSPHLHRPRSSASGGSLRHRLQPQNSSQIFVKVVPSVAVSKSLAFEGTCSGCALRFERAFAIAALVFRTREAQSAFVGRAAAFAAFGLSTLSDADCPDVSHLLQTRNVHPACFCLCPGSLHGVQYYSIRICCRRFCD